ncbi:hypothetical protein J6590_024626 [Homalodisca vitripennis]|nr:hypothetical protein J6590_024626 [Homalodisca vitripennis]
MQQFQSEPPVKVSLLMAQLFVLSLVPPPVEAGPDMLKLTKIECGTVSQLPYRTTPLVLPGAKIKKDALPTESYLRHHPNPLMRAPPPLHGLPHEVLMKQKVADTILQRVVADDPNKKVMPQFNSPIGLYSEDNIVNTIQQQTGATPIYPPPSEAPCRRQYLTLKIPFQFLLSTVVRLLKFIQPFSISISASTASYKKTVVYDPAKSETYKALKESEFGDTLQEIPTPVEPKVFSPAKVNTKTTPHRSVAAHSVPGPMHNINSIGASAENIQQSNTFKRLMHMVLEEENY